MTKAEEFLRDWDWWLLYQYKTPHEMREYIKANHGPILYISWSRMTALLVCWRDLSAVRITHRGPELASPDLERYHQLFVVPKMVWA